MNREEMAEYLEEQTSLEDKPLKFTTFDCLLFCVKVIALAMTICLIFDANKPAHYKWLFLLPFSFLSCVYVFPRLRKESFNNLALTLLVVLFFCRMVVSPAFLFLGRYAVTIEKNIRHNTTKSVFLMVYELFAVFGLLEFILWRKEWNAVKNKQMLQEVEQSRKQFDENRAFFLLSMIVIFCGILYASFAAIVPEMFSTLRTILDIRDADFTSFEDSFLIDYYAKNEIDKFAIVCGTYLIRCLLLLVPAYLIMLFAKKKSICTLVLSFLTCLVPLFFIGGAIARSLLYALFLFLFVVYLFEMKRFKIVMFCAVTVCGIAVLGYWILRSSDDGIFVDSSKRFSAYFSGVNVVSGVFNLPNGIADRFKYFTEDILGSIPFSGTLFNVQGGASASFFNVANASTGQIPPTIAMGYYYFGALLAPLYSLLFAWMAYKAGEWIKHPQKNRPFRYVLCIQFLFVCCMGIVMYNIEITLTNLFGICVPLWLLEWFVYGKKCAFTRKRGKRRRAE